MISSRRSILPALLALALGASACGQSEEPTLSGEAAGEGISQLQSEAETEGVYLDVGGLKYQVQLSRQLNPLLRSDQGYFDGVPAEELSLLEDEVWFGVFLRAENETDEVQSAARRFEIKDTQENIFVPVGLGPDNPFAWAGRLVEPDELIPDVDTGAGERPPNGGLLLFKLKEESLNNRPLALLIYSPTGEERGSVNIDV